MDNLTVNPQGVEWSESLLVNLGNAADLTQGEGGDGSEDKRNEYN